MTRAQKTALRFAYDLLHGRLKNQPHVQALPGIHILTPADRFEVVGIWLEPDRDPDHPFLNEAVFASLVMRGYLECRQFPPRSLWLYRITPEGCTAIGKHYPGIPPSSQPPLKRNHREEQAKLQPPNRPDHRDPHRFRRSSDWRRQ